MDVLDARFLTNFVIFILIKINPSYVMTDYLFLTSTLHMPKILSHLPQKGKHPFSVWHKFKSLLHAEVSNPFTSDINNLVQPLHRHYFLFYSYFILFENLFKPRQHHLTVRMLLTSSVLSATSKLYFEQPAASFLVCSLIFIGYQL